MSNLKQHKNISRSAYKLIKPYIKNHEFPRYIFIKIFDVIFSPDLLHSFKFIKGFDSFNHLNAESHKQGVEKCIKYYEKLQNPHIRKFKKCMIASWFAHFLVDSLEPAHLTEWKIPKNRKATRKNLSKHVKLERYTKKTRTDNVINLEINIDDDLNRYIDEISNNIRDLNILDIFPNDRDKIDYLYKEIVIPLQIKSVASYWYKTFKK